MNARIPNRAFAPVSASSGSPDPTGTSGSMPPPCGRSTSALAPMARSNRSSPTILIGVLHPSAPRTTRRSSIPTSAGRATTTKLGDHALLTHPTLDQLHAPGLPGRANAFAAMQAGGDAASLGHAEWLALLLEREASLRRDKRLSKPLQ